MKMLSIIEDTKKAIESSYLMRRFAIENFVRDLLIIGNDSYSFVQKWTYKEKFLQNVFSDLEYRDAISLLYYNKKYDSYLNACIKQESVEWYWVSKQLAKLETYWDMIPVIFPTVLHSDEDDVTGLIKFARAAVSSNNINIKVNESGAVYIDGVYPFRGVNAATGERCALIWRYRVRATNTSVLAIRIVAARTRHSASPPNLPQLLNHKLRTSRNGAQGRLRSRSPGGGNHRWQNNEVPSLKGVMGVTPGDFRYQIEVSNRI